MITNIIKNGLKMINKRYMNKRGIENGKVESYSITKKLD